jgi:type IV secretory pathway TraG/TraD family ATPase VirD4
MSTPNRQPGLLESWGVVIACAVVLLAVLVLWGAGAAGDAINGRTPEANPFAFPFDLAFGRRAWPGLPATLVLVGLVVVLAALLVVGALLVSRSRRKTSPTMRLVDAAAQLMGRPRDLRPLSPQGVAESAARLRPGSTIDPNDPTQHGRYIGATVVGSMPARSSVEDNGTHIWGPRRGKTTSLTIPNVIEWDGPVIATSNKRDLVDATRECRADRGRIWVFDPQQVAGAAPTWWFNPLAQISTIGEARILASHFVSGTRDPNARTDSYFDGSAEQLLAAYLLAAALDGHSTLIDVYKWLANSQIVKPQTLLAQHGQELVAADVRSIQEAPDKQRVGVYDTSKTLLQCLLNPAVQQWVTPPHRPRELFDPAAFVRSRDTLYSLSMEGPGAAAPLVAALTEQVCTAAIAAGTKMPLGRLDAPLYCCLDEAANVVRWRQLPDLYSHFGSRGIVVDTILQSWAQGVEVWGADGMKKLWSAANVRTYGGGVTDTDFLRALSDLVGEHDREVWSRSFDHQGRRSRSSSPRTDRRMPVDLLGSMPAGRALVMASGCPTFIVRTRPWWQTEFADQVRDSIASHDPGALAPAASIAP